jgi:DNA-binding transcriptional LysR family regulator
MDLSTLRVFLAVARERSFSKAAAHLHRTQPAVSQAIRRLEDDLGEPLFDRSAKDGRLTEAGRVLVDYAERLLRLSDEAEGAVRELRDLRRGLVTVGANEAAIHTLLAVVARFRQSHPQIQVDVRRLPSRQIGAEVLQRSLDFGVLTFSPKLAGLGAVTIGDDELVMLVHPGHPLAKRRKISMEEFGRQAVIAHNEASPARERVLRLFALRHTTLDIRLALPSLDAIKRAVGMGLGVAILPHRCAVAELSRGELVAVNVPELHLKRRLRLVYRKTGAHSHAAHEFLRVVQDLTADV